MFLSDTRIRAALASGEIAITPMAEWAIGSNSIDLHLSPELLVYSDRELSTRHAPSAVGVRIDSDAGFLLRPGVLYLGTTIERTNTGPYLPFIDGTSSAGRLGLGVHITAGIGDVGFRGTWTLEITVVHPVRVYGGEPVAQLLLAEVAGAVSVPYDRKPSANYAGQTGPAPSRLHLKRRFLG